MRRMSTIVSLVVLAALAVLSGAIGDQARAEIRAGPTTGRAVQSPTGEPGRAPVPPAAIPGKPTVATPPAKAAPMPPIVFFTAKGEPNACGPGCSEWIAAEGTIDPGAEDRLRALLKRLGGRKLPIYFHSPGGSVPDGLAIGRLMRHHGMTAGVAWTVPAGCDPNQQREPACDKLKRSGRELAAALDGSHVMCNSSCVYALVGAAVREVGAGVKLGVHSSSVLFSLRRMDAEGHVTRTTTHVAPVVERKALQGGYDRIAVYLREMGISAGLLAAAREVANDRVRFLTRDEIFAFGIDRRDRVESPWWFVDKAPVSAIKIIEAKGSEAGPFRRTILRLACRTSLGLQFQYGHEVGAEKATLPPRLRVTAGEGHYPLGRAVTVGPSDNALPLEVRGAELPVTVLRDEALVVEAAAPAGTATPTAGAGAQSTAADAGFAKLTAQNMGPGLGALARHCSSLPAPAPRAPARGT